MCLSRLPRTHTSSRPKQETYSLQPAKTGRRRCPFSPQAWAKALGCLSGCLPKRRRSRRKTVPKSSEPSEGAPKDGRSRVAVATDAGMSTMEMGATILKEVADLALGVPYLQIIASVLSQIVKVHGEVRMLSDKCSDLKKYVNELKRLVDGIKSSLRMTEHMPDDLAQALHFLTGALDDTVRVYKECTAKTSLRKILKRGLLLGEIQKCEIGVQNALTLFNTKLGVIQFSDAQKAFEILEDTRGMVKCIQTTVEKQLDQLPLPSDESSISEADDSPKPNATSAANPTSKCTCSNPTPPGAADSRQDFDHDDNTYDKPDLSQCTVKLIPPVDTCIGAMCLFFLFFLSLLTR